MLKLDAITHYGSAQKVADACGLRTRQAVYGWPKEVPAIYQFRLHYHSKGKLKLSRHLRRKSMPVARRSSAAAR